MIVFLAALSMFVQDLLCVVMVQAEARNKAVLAGVMDALAWPVGIFCTTVSVTALQSHQLGMITLVIIAVTLANFFGSYVAVRLGKRWVKEKLEK